MSNPQEAKSQTQEEIIKKAFEISADQRKDADRVLARLQDRNRNCCLADLLVPVARSAERGDQDTPVHVLRVLIRRVMDQLERSRGKELRNEKFAKILVALEAAKQTLQRIEQKQ